MATRARTREAKQRRHQAILDAAAAVWARSTFDQFTMAGVARGARLAKGTLYLYFATKEELLLELLRGRLDGWLFRLETALEAKGTAWTPEDAAELIAAALVADENLARLLMILGAILEHNVPERRIREFKTWLLGRLGRTGGVLERRLPFLGGRGGVRLLLHLEALICGLGQLARPAPAVARVLAAPELEPFRLDFEAELRLALTALMRGFSAALDAAGSGVPKTHGGRHEG